MSVVVVRDKSEIYDRILRGRQTLVQQHPALISVRAPDLDEQERNNLQSEIQAVLDRTLQRTNSVEARAGREPPSDEQVRRMIHTQFRSAPPGESRQRPSRKRGVRVTMTGLKLPKGDRRALESEVRQLVLKRLDGVSHPRSRQQVVVCGCGIFGGCCDRPGATIDLTQIDPLPAGTGDPRTTPIMIAIYMPPMHSPDDVIAMGIWDPDPRDPSERDMTQNQVLVGLRIDAWADSDQWAKEIQGWKTCMCGVETVHQDSYSVGYKWMFIEKDTVETLVFRKAEFFGMTDKYSFDPVEFWKLLGGKILTFDWLYDGGFDL